MRRLTSLAVFLAAASLLGPSARVASSGAPVHERLPVAFPVPPSPFISDDLSETEALIAKAHAITNLTAPGSVPFRLHASLSLYDPSGDPRIPPTSGTYDFTWESPEKWREDVDVLHLKQTLIADGAKLWTKRNAPYPSYSYWWTHNALDVTRGIVYPFDSYTHIEIAQNGGRNMVCAKNGHPILQRALCLDTATAIPLMQFDPVLHLQFTFSNWTQWGNHIYPRKIKAYSDDELVIVIDVADISAAPPDSRWLNPPQNSVPRDWCSDMRPLRLGDAIENLQLPEPILPGGATKVVGAIVYGMVGKDGSWLDLSVLEASDFKAAYKMLESLQQYQSQPAACHGTPVESDTIFRVSRPR